jgi:hypothetical protein
VDLRAGLDVKRSESIPSAPCRESNPGRPVRGLVAILTELLWLRNIFFATPNVAIQKESTALLTVMIQTIRHPPIKPVPGSFLSV